MEKGCSSKESHPLGPVNFSERLYENKADALSKPKALEHAMIREFKLRRF